MGQEHIRLCNRRQLDYSFQSGVNILVCVTNWFVSKHQTLQTWDLCLFFYFPTVSQECKQPQCLLGLKGFQQGATPTDTKTSQIVDFTFPNEFMVSIYSLKSSSSQHDVLKLNDLPLELLESLVCLIRWFPPLQ